MYGAETWVLSKADELRLGVFERKILRRIYGPNCEGAIWRSRYNEELCCLYDETDLVTSIRITRHRWAGHIIRMQDNLPCKKITLDKPEGRRGWESEIGGSRPGTEMVGGDFLSQPRCCMGCSAWVDGWIEIILI